MANLRTILGSVLVAAVLVYGGLYAYMYSKINNAVQLMAMQLGLLGRLEYDGISVSPLGGKIDINHISFTPHDFHDPLLIDKLRLRSSGLFDLLDVANLQPTSRFPDSINLQFMRMRVSVHSDWLRHLDGLARQATAAADYRPATCGGLQFLGPTQYSEMGYAELVSDMSLGYRYEQRAAQLVTHMELSTRDMAGVEFRFAVSAPPTLSMLGMAQSGPPELLDYRVTYTDLGYTPRANAYCAKADDLPLADYIEAVVSQPNLDYLMQWGFVPGDEIRQAYREFLTRPQSIQFIIHPAADFNPGMLAMYKPQDIPLLLNLQVRVNDRLLGDLEFKTAQDLNIRLPGKSHSIAANLAHLGPLLSREAAAAPPPSAPVARPAQPQFHTIPPAELPRHVGREVKIHIDQGLVREGILERIDGNTLYVERSLRGGKITMPVTLGQISKVEVFY